MIIQWTTWSIDITTGGFTTEHDAGFIGKQEIELIASMMIDQNVKICDRNEDELFYFDINGECILSSNEIIE